MEAFHSQVHSTKIKSQVNHSIQVILHISLWQLTNFFWFRHATISLTPSTVEIAQNIEHWDEFPCKGYVSTLRIYGETSYESCMSARSLRTTKDQTQVI